MPVVLVVTATTREADALLATPAGARATAVTLGPRTARRTAGLVVLAGGVGPAAAAAATADALAALAAQPCALVVSAGVGGGFAPHAAIGDLVVATALVAADLGAQDPASPDGFTDLAALGFPPVRRTPHPSLAAALVAAGVACVPGPVLTVSTVTGTATRADLLQRRHGAVAEAMEGWGVAEAAAAHGVPCAELRGVSNPVGPRDRAAWDLPAGLAALTRAADVLHALDPAAALP